MALSSEAPLARSRDLIVEELGDEVLVYDTKTNTGHSLSPEAAKVWRACNGTTSAEKLSVKLGLGTETVDRSLEELSAFDLLEVRPTIIADGSTRRQVTIKLAKVGAAATAAPLIISALAPTAAMAVSPATCLHFSGNCGGGGGGEIGCKEIPGCCCCTAGGGCPDATPPDPSPSCKECLPQGNLCPSGGPADNC